MPTERRTHGRTTPADEMLALRIEAFRLRAGLSVTELATRLGVKRPRVSHWINRRFEPPRSMIPRLATALGVSVERLMGEGLTPEQEAAERRYLLRVIRGGERIAALLDHFTDEELERLLAPHVAGESKR